MSKIFYDHLIILEEIEVEIKYSAETSEEKEELWKLVDEIIHHRVLEAILDTLPREHHGEFLERFHEAPHDVKLLSYLNEKVEGDIEDLIRKEIDTLKGELLHEIKGKNKNG